MPPDLLGWGSSSSQRCLPSPKGPLGQTPIGPHTPPVSRRLPQPANQPFSPWDSYPQTIPYAPTSPLPRSLGHVLYDRSQSSSLHKDLDKTPALVKPKSSTHCLPLTKQLLFPEQNTLCIDWPCSKFVTTNLQTSLVRSLSHLLKLASLPPSLPLQPPSRSSALQAVTPPGT